jgi:hypothetical protein
MKQFYKRKTAPISTALLPNPILLLRHIAKKSINAPAPMRPLPMMISVLNDKAPT